MTDITELSQSLKAAAKRATPGQWVAFTDTPSRTFSVHTPDDKRCGDVIKWAGFDGQRKAKANAEFIAQANPANILALVEALEKAQAKIALVAGGIEAAAKLHGRIAELEEKYENRTPTEWAYNQVCKALQSHKDLIAELELRTVKLPGWFVKDAIAVYDRDEVEEALTAAGIKWEAE